MPRLTPLSENLRKFQHVSKDSLWGNGVLSAAMKRSSSYLLAALLCGFIATGSRTVPAQGKKTRAAKSANARTIDYPKTRAAIAALEAAKAELQSSSKGFGGHKREAIGAVNDALKRLRLALQFEKY